MTQLLELHVYWCVMLYSIKVSVCQYFCSLLLIFCLELASAVWTYDEVRKLIYCELDMI